MRRFFRIARLVVFLLFCSCSNSKQSRGSAMTQFVDDYFNAYFEWNPSAATSVGFHQYDGNIEDYSAAAVAKGIEKIIAAMKQNIDNPPREFTELAFRIAHGSVGFFRTSVANWAKDAASDDTALLNEFATANAAAANSLQDAADWLQKTLLPKS